MEKIASFNIDHNKLLRGIYVSRVDNVGDQKVTTFDIRMKEPNRQPIMDLGALHTIEHIAATYIRNRADWSDRVIYWGPMGCCTGNYFIAIGEYKSEDIVELMRDTFEFVASYNDEVPGVAPRDCGNYSCHSLEGAKAESQIYLDEVLNVIEAKNLNYPD